MSSLGNRTSHVNICSSCGYLQATPLEPNWEKYSSMFNDRMLDVYEGRNVGIAMIEAGQDEQGEHYMNRVLARSKMDVNETANRIKDRRFALEDQMRQGGIPVANVERMMNAFNRAYAVAVHHLECIDQEALLMLSNRLEAAGRDAEVNH